MRRRLRLGPPCLASRNSGTPQALHGGDGALVEAERERESEIEMASVVRGALKAIRGKGFGKFLSELKEDGYSSVLLFSLRWTVDSISHLLFASVLDADWLFNVDCSALFCGVNLWYEFHFAAHASYYWEICFVGLCWWFEWAKLVSIRLRRCYMLCLFLVKFSFNSYFLSLRGADFVKLCLTLLGLWAMVLLP